MIEWLFFGKDFRKLINDLRSEGNLRAKGLYKIKMNLYGSFFACESFLFVSACFWLSMGKPLIHILVFIFLITCIVILIGRNFINKACYCYSCGVPHIAKVVDFNISKQMRRFHLKYEFSHNGRIYKGVAGPIPYLSPEKKMLRKCAEILVFRTSRKNNTSYPWLKKNFISYCCNQKNYTKFSQLDPYSNETLRIYKGCD